MKKLKLPLAVLLAAAGAFSLIQLGKFSSQADIVSLFIYQAASLAISAIVILAIWLSKSRKLEYLRLGEWEAPAEPMVLLGVKPGESWSKVGRNFSVVVSLATGTFLYFAYQGELSAVAAQSWMLAFVLAIPLAVLNAFNEEIITRWAIVESASGTGYERLAPGLSAVVFGVAHYFGIPGGFIGSLMAGFLAWLLSRSIQDTKGIGWAWLIHILQDILILTVVIAISL